MFPLIEYRVKNKCRTRRLCMEHSPTQYTAFPLNLSVNGVQLPAGVWNYRVCVNLFVGNLFQEMSEAQLDVVGEVRSMSS
jgi:hypothetical protein